MKNASYWLDVPYVQRTPLDRDIQVDVVIIGGGITGVSAAYHCAKNGLKTALVEKHSIASGSAGKNLGMVVEGLEIDLLEAAEKFGAAAAKGLWGKTVEARDLTAALVREHLIECDMDASGSLYLARDSEYMDWLRKESAARQDDGFSCRIMEKGKSADAGEEFAGSIFAGGLVAPKDCMLDPVKFVRGLAHAAENFGLLIYENTDALRYDAHSVKTSNGTVSAKKVVLAIESDTAEIEAGKTVVTRIQAVATEPLSAEQFEKMDWNDIGGFWTSGQKYLSVRRLGSRLFMTGGKIGLNPSVEELAACRAAILSEFASYFPNLDASSIAFSHAWTGLLLYNKEVWHPYVSERRGYYEIFGNGGNGLTNGVIIGKLLADSFIGKELPQIYRKD